MLSGLCLCCDLVLGMDVKALSYSYLLELETRWCSLFRCAYLLTEQVKCCFASVSLSWRYSTESNSRHALPTGSFRTAGEGHNAAGKKTPGVRGASIPGALLGLGSPFKTGQG